MKVLAIETSTLTGSIALISDDLVLGETTLSVSIQHSERLMPAIEQLLKEAGSSVGDIDLFAVAEGPGSFTGLRIGIAAAQGFAMSQGKPVVGVSTLEALAQNAYYFAGTVVPMLNAFRGEIYWRFGGRDRVASPAEVIATLDAISGPILLMGNAVSLCEELIESKKEKLSIAPSWMHVPRAVHVATLAADRFVKEGAVSQVLPLYLRHPG